MGEYSCDYRVYTKKIYIISGKVKRFKVQLLRSNALFLCRHEDTSSLRLFSDERSGRQIIRNFSFRQKVKKKNIYIFFFWHHGYVHLT